MFQHLDLLFSSTPLEGPEQMALDEILLRQLEQPLLRLYYWKAPCITFGYFQKLTAVRQLFPREALVRRWSGGGCVEHGDDATFSLIVPASEPSGIMAPSRFYHVLHEAIVQVLQQHEMMARLTTCEEIKEGESCFKSPRLHDILLEGDKIVGGAQRRSAGSLLHQGSLNLSGRWEAENRRSETFIPQTKENFNQKIFTSLADQLSKKVTLIEEKSAWMEEARKLAVERYRSETWMKKR